jgi:D-arabinose 1-dehydrogenase-like Zn-dependent alcohol dehydrogenase
MGLKTIGIDISQAQLEAIKALGADVVINTMDEPDFEAKVKKLTNGGCHAAAVFSASNAAYENAPKVLRYVYIFRSIVVNDHECTKVNIG